MTKILILSDTHSYLDPRLIKHIKSVDLVLHAGDIGNISVMDEIIGHKPVIGVQGNIDDHIVKSEYPKDQIFTLNNKKIIITHIAGYPNRYKPYALNLIQREKPDLFICGHSHVLKVIYDQKLQHLHINPGACGKHGFHKIQTAIKLKISESGQFKDLQIIELERK